MHTQGPNQHERLLRLVWTRSATRFGFSPGSSAAGNGKSQPVAPKEPHFVQQAFRYLLLMGASSPDDSLFCLAFRMLWRRGALDHTGLGAQTFLSVSHQSSYRTA